MDNEEWDEDFQPGDAHAQKYQRRSGRTKQATAYHYDDDNSEEEEELRSSTRMEVDAQDLSTTTSAARSGKEIEAILHVAWRPRAEWDALLSQINTSKVRNGSRLRDDNEQQEVEQGEEPEERFLIKWKDASRLHCSWELARDLCAKLPVVHAASRIEPRLKKARLVPPGHYAKEGGFNPEFKRVDRVLAVSAEEEADGQRAYYIKWCILGYDEATWELELDLINNAVEYQEALEQYHARELRDAELSSQSLAQLNARLNTRTPFPLFKESPLFGKNRRLRAYQLEALNWLCFNWLQNRSSILADEMGLGKTACSVAFANTVCKSRGPVLVVAPLPVVPHFAREFAAWTDLNVVLLRGNPKARAICKELEFYPSKHQQGKWYKFDVLITNYETVLEEEAALTACPWGLVIVDEGHRLKNRNSKLTQLLRDRMDKRSVLLLTGTPIQNDTTELWTLLNFIDPARFANLDEFVRAYGAMKTAKQMDDFHTMLKPYLLRRFKTDVEANLPSKEEIVIEVELTELQKYYYRSVYEQNVQTLLRGVVAGTRLNLNNVAMQLRKVCNHPYLIDGVEAKSLADRGLSTSMMDERAMLTLIEASGKFILLDKLLPKLKDQNHRVLIFSQFVRVLDILEDYCRFRQYGYERIDGSVNGMRRQEAIDRFSTEGSTSFCFLLSTRGCGQGINLTAADTVILFDNDWNPQNDVQAQARCHRIGQTKPVSIYRMITRKTYEQEMFNRASLKLGLDEAMTSKLKDQQMESADADEAKLGAGVSDAELEHMLKFGAYALMSEDTSAESKAFCEADIDSILTTRAKRVSLLPNSDNQAAAAGTSKFSKATFVSNTLGEVTEMDDPQFWTKILGKDVVASKQQQDGEEREGKAVRRSRRRINYDETGEDEAAAAAAASAAAAAAADSPPPRSAAAAAAASAGPPTLSMTSAKNLITGLTSYAFGRYADICKKVGVQMKESDCARYSLGIGLLCCVWRSQEDRSGGFPFPLSDSEEDVTNACKSLAGILTREPKPDIYLEYAGPLRKSLLARLSRELALHPFEVTKSMMLLPRLKERCKETVQQLADVIDVDNYCTGETSQIGTFVRGVPPTLAWVGADDKALLASFYKYGFERRRKLESWKTVFGDASCGWTRQWILPASVEENDEDANAAPVSEDVLSMKRLSSRLNRIIASLTEPIAPEKPAPPVAVPSDGAAEKPAPSHHHHSTAMSEATRLRKKREAEQGEVQLDWNATEKERLTHLIMRWGVPREEPPGPALLGLGRPPTWQVFQDMLPRKTLESIQERVRETIAAFREMDNCPPSKKGVLNRADLMAGLWRHLEEDYGLGRREDLASFLGAHFKGVQRHQKQMPAWWTPQLDISLLRAVCQYGVGAWQEALSNPALFPSIAQLEEENLPGSYPSPKDLNSRFVAVVDWLLLNAKRPVATVDRSGTGDGGDFAELITRGAGSYAEQVARGERLLSTPSMQDIRDYMDVQAASAAAAASLAPSRAGGKKQTASKSPTKKRGKAQEFEDDPVQDDDMDDDEHAFED